MGRTFDAIHRSEVRRSRRGESTSASATSTLPHPAPDAEADTETDSVVIPSTATPVLHVPDLPANASFIEVGRARLDGSPDVLAVPVPRSYLSLDPGSLSVPEPTSPELPEVRLLPVPGAPTIVSGTLPAEVIAYHEPTHSLALQYRQLTTGLLDLRPGLGPRTFAFTTALAGMPLTAVLLNVGTTAARMAARRVVVIEADLRQPTLADVLHLPRSPGLVEVLSGVVPGEQAVRSTSQPNLLVLPAGDVSPEALSLLRVEPLRQLFQRLSLRADLLLLALPRWDGRPDVLAPSACCDALFVIAPEAEADQPHLAQVLTQVPALGVPLAGTVLLAV